MSSDRIEVSEQANFDLWICGSKIAEYLLDHPLGPAVRICADTERRFFCKRNVLAHAVYCRGRTEYELAHTIFLHEFGYRNGAHYIVPVVIERYPYRFADSLKAGKMNNAVDLILFEHLTESFLVAAVDVIEFEGLACYLLEPSLNLEFAVRQVVCNYHFIAALMKRDYGMRSDISVTTGYKNSRHIKLL